MGDFGGKRALVTGAGAGIGRAVAHHLADAGAAVACLDLDNDAATRVADTLGGGAMAVCADVSDDESVSRAVDTVVEGLGGLDIVVNNAGVVILKGIEETTLDDWDRTLDVNVRSVFLVTQRTLPALKESSGAAIVNISSIAALRFSHLHPAYAASKGGVVALTRETAVELAKYGIRVNSVAPGPVKTEALDGLTDAQLADAGFNFLLGQMARPHDIAEAVAFLASPRAAAITGVTLPVTGGVELPTSAAPLPWNEI